MKEHDLQNINFSSEDEGYMLEVDLEYPKELHDLRNDYPVLVYTYITFLFIYLTDLLSSFVTILEPYPQCTHKPIPSIY